MQLCLFIVDEVQSSYCPLAVSTATKRPGSIHGAKMEIFLALQNEFDLAKSEAGVEPEAV